jgi:hypothetical protein
VNDCRNGFAEAIPLLGQAGVDATSIKMLRSLL